MVPALEITAPQLLSARTNFWMITSSSRKISGRPVFVLYLGIDLLSVVLFSLLSLSFSSHFYLKERTFIEFWKFSLESLYWCCWAMFRGVLSDIITIFITPFDACDFIRWQLYCIDGWIDYTKINCTQACVYSGDTTNNRFWKRKEMLFSQIKWYTFLQEAPQGGNYLGKGYVPPVRAQRVGIFLHLQSH